MDEKTERLLVSLGACHAQLYNRLTARRDRPGITIGEDLAARLCQTLSEAIYAARATMKQEAPIDRECRPLGHEFVYGAHAEDEFPPLRCRHCGVEASP